MFIQNTKINSQFLACYQSTKTLSVTNWKSAMTNIS
jgi:hypothetical protein